MKFRWFVIPLIGLVLIFPAVGQMTLSITERAVEKKYPLPNISHESLASLLLESSGSAVIFDTRKKEEFEVSRIQDAIWIDPEMTAEAFIKNHGPQLAGKEVVFYCSVGYRSSIFLERVGELARKAGADHVFNLRGGIFRWYNEKLPVFDDEGETDEIHPYDSIWGALVVKRKN